MVGFMVEDSIGGHGHGIDMPWPRPPMLSSTMKPTTMCPCFDMEPRPEL